MRSVRLVGAPGVLKLVPIFALLVAVVCPAGCGARLSDDAGGASSGQTELPTVPRRQRFNLLLVTLDTTRADHLGSYGYAHASTPHLNRLASQGVRFEHVTAPVPLTLPSHASLFTGQYPFTHEVRDNVNFRLSAEAHTLAEVLGEAGYNTGGFIGAYVLNAATGMSQGFDFYTDFTSPGFEVPSHGDPVERSGGEVVAEARQWLETHQRGNFFAWVHLFDPHLPHEPPSPYRERHVGRPYDGEISYVDALVGELMDGLEKDGRAERTVVVVTADHGEGLGEHGESRHGALVYDATVRVPLLMWAPGVLAAGAVVDTPVSLVDVMPTLLEILDIEDPAAESRDGRDARTLMVDANTEPRPAYAESLYPLLEYGFEPQRAIRLDDYKFIHAAEPELYDVRTDAAETINLAADNPDVVARLDAALRALVGDDDPTRGFAATSGAAAEHLERLRALGYLGGGTPATEAIEMDTRTMVETTEAFEDGIAATMDLIAEQRWDEAHEVLEGLADLVPNDRVVRYYRGHTEMQRGNLAAAIVELQGAIEADPAYTLPYMDLANAYWQSGDRAETFEFLGRAVETFPETAMFRILLATYLQQDGQSDRALQVYQDARKLAPRDPRLLANLALLHLTRNEKSTALTLTRWLTEATPRDPQAWNRLALLLTDMGDYSGAQTALRHSLELDPGQPDVRYNLGLALILDAAGAFDQILLGDPGAAYAKQTLEQLLRSGALRPR